MEPEHLTIPVHIRAAGINMARYTSGLQQGWL